MERERLSIYTPVEAVVEPDVGTARTSRVEVTLFRDVHDQPLSQCRQTLNGEAGSIILASSHASIVPSNQGQGLASTSCRHGHAVEGRRQTIHPCNNHGSRRDIRSRRYE